jgi:hypothetical protein
MTLDEKIGQMTQSEQQTSTARRDVAVHRIGAERRGFVAAVPTGGGLGDLIDGYRRRAGDAPADPDDLRHRRRARTRQGDRRDRVSPTTSPRRHA